MLMMKVAGCSCWRGRAIQSTYSQICDVAEKASSLKRRQMMMMMMLMRRMMLMMMQLRWWARRGSGADAA